MYCTHQIKKVKLSLYKGAWSPIGLWHVEAPTFSRQLAHRWRWGCQLQAPAALYPPGRFLVLISVKSWVHPRAIELFGKKNWSTVSKSRDSSVGITTGYGLDDQGVGVRVPMRSRIFCSPRRPDRYPMGTEGSFPRDKAAGAWSWPLTSSENVRRLFTDLKLMIQLGWAVLCSRYAILADLKGY
jgi:hypothetical protein